MHGCRGRIDEPARADRAAARELTDDARLGGVGARLHVLSEQHAARRAEALLQEQPRLVRDRLERERERVRRLPGRVERRLQLDRLRPELSSDVGRERGDVFHRLRRGRTEAVAGRGTVEQPRGGVRVGRGERVVVQADDPRAEAESRPAACLPEAVQRRRRGSLRPERAIARCVGLEVDRRLRQDADPAVPREHAAAPVVGNGDADRIAAEFEHLRGELVRPDMLQLLRIEEDLDAGVHDEKLRRTSSLGSTPSPGPSGSRARTPSMSSGSASVASSS